MRLIVSISLLILVAGLAAPVPAPADDPTVLRIDNGATPAHGVRDIRLEELWRVGGEDDEDFLFGSVVQVLDDDDGNIYLMDSQLNEVTVLTPDGEFLKTLGGEGDGPGEIRGLGGMLFLPDGRFGMIQTFPGRVVTLMPDDTPGPSFHFRVDETTDSNFGVIVGGVARGGTFALTGLSMSMQGAVNLQTYYLALCDTEGQQVRRLFEKNSTIDYADFVADEASIDFVWARFNLGPDGLLYAAPHRNRYEIEVYGPDGVLRRVIAREYESYTRTGDEMEMARRFVEAYGRNYPVPPRECTVEEVEADIAGLRVTDAGELWVTTSRSAREAPDGAASLLDVFDADGRFDRQVAVHGDLDLDRDIVQFLGEDRVVVVAGAGEGYLNSMGVSGGEDAEEVPALEVVCYAVR